MRPLKGTSLAPGGTWRPTQEAASRRRAVPTQQPATVLGSPCQVSLRRHLGGKGVGVARGTGSVGGSQGRGACTRLFRQPLGSLHPEVPLKARWDLDLKKRRLDVPGGLGGTGAGGAQSLAGHWPECVCWVGNVTAVPAAGTALTASCQAAAAVLGTAQKQPPRGPWLTGPVAWRLGSRSPRSWRLWRARRHMGTGRRWLVGTGRRPGWQACTRCRARTAMGQAWPGSPRWAARWLAGRCSGGSACGPSRESGPAGRVGRRRAQVEQDAVGPSPASSSSPSGTIGTSNPHPVCVPTRPPPAGGLTAPMAPAPREAFPAEPSHAPPASPRTPA